MTRDTITGALTRGEPIEIPEVYRAARLEVTRDGRYLIVSGSGITIFSRAVDGSLTYVSHLAGVGDGNVDVLPMSSDGQRVFANGDLVDISDPAGASLVDSIDDQIGFGHNGHAADPAFNHLYSVGYDTTDEVYKLSLFHLLNRPVSDVDEDGIADEIDNCRLIPNSNQVDSDADGLGDACDPDDDNDGVLDDMDAFPTDPAEWLDTDSDGIGNNADLDDDNDSLSDESEINVYMTNPLRRDTDGDGLSDGDEVEMGLNPLDSTDCPEELCPPESSLMRILILLQERAG